MSSVATAIIGGAVIGAVATDRAGDKAAAAAESGATTAAQAQILSTQMQVDEITRQFDYQQQILLPQIQQQYNAQGAFADLLGVGGLQVGQNAETGYIPQPRSMERQQAIRKNERDLYDQLLAEGQMTRQEYDQAINELDNRPYESEIIAQDNVARGPQFPTRGSTTFRRGSRGEFVDPNLDPTRLADVSTFGNEVRSNLLAGTSPGEDPYRSYIDENRIAAATPELDARVARARDVTMTGARGNVLAAPTSLSEDQIRRDIGSRSLAAGAAGTGVYGDTFETSPGYEFAVEQQQRATDRLLSRGGNYGGRAVLEAQRRAKGLASQEYYNWAAGRTSDLQRLGAAEAADIGRLDTSAYDYQNRINQDIARGDTFAMSDIARGDEALAGYEAQRIADVGRGDQAYQDYLSRRKGDVSRLDAAAQQKDQLMAADQQRTDQNYYNYLSNLSRLAGFGGGPAATAVSASRSAGAQTANAYGNEGSNLSSIYNSLGQNLGGIAAQAETGKANAITSGIQNWLTYNASKPTPSSPTPSSPAATPTRDWMTYQPSW